MLAFGDFYMLVYEILPEGFAWAGRSPWSGPSCPRLAGTSSGHSPAVHTDRQSASTK